MVLGLYLACFLFGGTLLAASVMLGGGDQDSDAGGHDHDHDVAADHDHDVAADHDADADHEHDVKVVMQDVLRGGPSETMWLPFLSFRFWTFGTATFGATGALLWILGFADLVSAGISAPTGIVLGAAAAWIFRQIRADRVTADVGLGRIVGHEARVLLPVRPGDVGKILVKTPGGRVELPARTRDEHEIDAGATVLVTEVANGIADVTSISAPPKHRATKQGVPS